MRNRCLFVTLLGTISLCPPSAASADRASAQFIGGAQTKSFHFTDYTADLEELGYSVHFAEINTNPLTSNHREEIARIRREVDELETQPEVFLGYSVGGKFAARLALDAYKSHSAPLLILIDPVGGQPPLQRDRERFPDLISEEDEPLGRNIPTLILHSELGTRRGPLGIACVKPDFGADFFASIFSNAALLRQPGAGHLDYLIGRIPNVFRLSCYKGQTDPQLTRQSARSAIRSFLDR